MDLLRFDAPKMAEPATTSLAPAMPANAAVRTVTPPSTYHRRGRMGRKVVDEKTPRFFRIQGVGFFRHPNKKGDVLMETHPHFLPKAKCLQKSELLKGFCVVSNVSLVSKNDAWWMPMSLRSSFRLRSWFRTTKRKRCWYLLIVHQKTLPNYLCAYQQCKNCHLQCFKNSCNPT